MLDVYLTKSRLILKWAAKYPLMLCKKNYAKVKQHAKAKNSHENLQKYQRTIVVFLYIIGYLFIYLLWRWGHQTEDLIEKSLKEASKLLSNFLLQFLLRTIEYLISIKKSGLDHIHISNLCLDISPQQSLESEQELGDNLNLEKLKSIMKN